jgi:IS30 family transposase
MGRYYAQLRACGRSLPEIGEFQARAENAFDYELPIATLFCDVHASWQRGGIENAIGRPHRFLPRRTGLDVFQDGEIEKTYRTYNIRIPEMRWLQNPKRDLRYDS